MQFGIFSMGDVTQDPIRLAEDYAFLQHQAGGRSDLFYGHGRADQAIVGLGGQVFIGSTEQGAKDFFRPYFDNAPVNGHGPSLEEFTAQTPLTVGTLEQVVPELRRRFEQRRPDHVPSDPPTHGALASYAPHALISPGEEK